MTTRTLRLAGRGAAIAVVATALAYAWTLPLRAAQGAGRRPPSTVGQASPLAELQRGFLSPPDDARIMMRWWWFGPAVTPRELERELRAMKEGGLGGVEIQPVYPLALDDTATGITTHPFLSDAFLDDVRAAAKTARGLGLRVDLTLGSGWPFGGPQVRIADAAGKLRIERVAVAPGSTRVAVPEIRAGERLLAAFLSPRASADRVGDLREIQEVADGVARVGAAAPEPREALFFISSRTGMMVKRPAVGAEGFVLNHYDREAVGRYLDSVGTRLMSAFGSDPPYAVFCDSLEVYESDWTDDFLDAFAAKRGYDLRPLLPALVIDSPASAGLRHDWGQTLTELVRERFLEPAQAWARQRGTRFRLQGYGVPPAVISSNAGVDLPEGEGSQWKTVRASRWAASIGHLYDRPVISSETWTWLHSPVFRATPLDLKAEADLHFLQGINQLIGHGWPYSAEGAAYPGWRFYAAGAFSDKNPWWIVMPDLARYLQRTSFLLRQGVPVNDVAVYLPVADTWASFVPGKVGSMIEALNQRVGPDVLPAVLSAGFNVDFIDDEVLRSRARLDRDAIVVGQNRYRAIVLPGVDHMSAATLGILEAAARSGVRVIATRRVPSRAPGYRATPADHAGVASAAARLFTDPGAAGAYVARDGDLGGALAAAIQPDMAVSIAAADLGVVHRRTPAADIYFVANTANVPVSARATFRVPARRAARWDAMTGRTDDLPVQRAKAGEGATVEVDLAPYESTVFVFPRDGAAPATPAAARVRPPAAAGRIDLSTGWRVRVGADAAVETWDTLRSWTDAERTRYFSGVATYERQADVPAAMLARGARVLLDFGAAAPVPPATDPGARVQAWLDAPVREAVVVTINGTRAGSVWCPPYRLDVTAVLRPGANAIRLDVANLAINHMAGHALPDYKLLNLRYGTRFEPQDMNRVQPVPAGLFGPIQLIAAPVPRSSPTPR